MTNPDSPEPKFRRRAEDRPDELLDAALALFVERGYARTSVAEIAKAAGLSKGAVYLYFPSKQAILEGLVRRAVTPLTDRVVAMPPAGADLRAVLTMVLRMIATELSKPETISVPALVIREAVNAPEIAEMYRREVFDQVLPRARVLISHAIAEGAFRPVDPDLTLRSIMGPVLMHLLLARVFGIGAEIDLDALVTNHLDILFHGLVAQPEPPHA